MSKKVIIAIGLGAVALLVLSIINFSSALKQQREIFDTGDDDFLMPVDPYHGSLMEALDG